VKVIALKDAARAAQMAVVNEASVVAEAVDAVIVMIAPKAAPLTIALVTCKVQAWQPLVQWLQVPLWRLRATVQRMLATLSKLVMKTLSAMKAKTANAASRASAVLMEVNRASAVHVTVMAATAVTVASAVSAAMAKALATTSLPSKPTTPQ
jgi:hypothetical protein